MCAIAELRSAAYSVDRLRAPTSEVASTLHHRAEDDSDIRPGVSDALSGIAPLLTLLERPVGESIQISPVLASAWLSHQFCFS